MDRKSFFKDVMHKEGVLPPEVIYRRKTWMFSPTAEWLRGPMHGTIQTLLRDSRLPERGLVDHAHVGRLLDAHRAGKRDNSRVLMMLAAVELWHQLFVDPPALAAPAGTLTDYASTKRG